jgi:hypothetical protein
MKMKMKTKMKTKKMLEKVLYLVGGEAVVVEQ